MVGWLCVGCVVCVECEVCAEVALQGSVQWVVGEGAGGEGAGGEIAGGEETEVEKVGGGGAISPRRALVRTAARAPMATAWPQLAAPRRERYPGGAAAWRVAST